MATKKKTTTTTRRKTSRKKASAGGNGSRLLVVESPAKARTIGRYLDDSFVVKASVGHIRDLPKRDLGVDVDNGFEPKYETIRGKGKVIKELKSAAKDASEILLATDPDREGEAIAYHVAEQLGFESRNGDRFKRVLFEEITPEGIANGLANPGQIDRRKVDAQQARRILDRLVGYKASPFLWKPIRPGLSAGRVQTVALRLIWEREEEIKAFEPVEYWTIEAALRKDDARFTAQLHHVDGGKPRLPNEDAAQAVIDAVHDVPFQITKIRRKERRKNPSAPFTTSTLQQQAAKGLRFSAKRTMRIAQQLYEGVEVKGEAIGLITYMRTDSTRIAGSAANGARGYVEQEFGSKYLPKSARLYSGKQQKGAQEAHEAIRPTSVWRTPDSLKGDLDSDQLKLYRLIWMRFVASQMSPAVYDTTTVDFDLEGNDGHDYLFRVTGSVLKFDGFTRLYSDAHEEGEGRTLGDLKALPDLSEGETVSVLGIDKTQHFTKPPARFSEASLVKELEKLGIGRPSTYASILSTLVERTYVELDNRRFLPTPLGETVVQVLIRVFPDTFDIGFTSNMEAGLDRIEEGELEWHQVLEDFYSRFSERLEKGEAKLDDIIEDIFQLEDTVCDVCGRPMKVKWNRYGRFLGCSGYPECRNSKPIDRPPEVDLEGQECPQCGGELVVKSGRYGPFVACSNYPDCRFTRALDGDQNQAVADARCPECDSPMAVKTGRYGEFLACTAYPECKHTQPITLGLHCPTCGEGEIVKRRTRRGRTFYGCSRYPECDWSTWDTPTGATCPVCGSEIALKKSSKKKGDFLRCVSCSHEFSEEAAETTGGGSD
ncbi:MAG: type I DNA topoisomerase [Gemmatimonadetes bacterium]|uniref:DNA topoisomerase 1 n=1 Tax=Candidatus Kutchimonas denitrificans TaxID=3056748 RepID=A0AAE4Z670_9BACT|nr:type I DNA topoisomerase [Gemmatimonadota bacterium]NIR73753.1 type I DNA topoisomerase [Candidatus Kutchimonas denitrificans]NIS03117.1 type I DNA topoisomerase [Gemmatimonadota bacterium]NIT69018.1 type I DNA topoisomerase [Gemmatimonadota bacterium]NIU54109.1 type I DNA topoisomerase [Gemmatimonadota bacterium]